jgi:hypothetical protein
MISKARGGNSSRGNTLDDRVPVEETDTTEDERDRQRMSSACLEPNNMLPSVDA